MIDGGDQDAAYNLAKKVRYMSAKLAIEKGLSDIASTNPEITGITALLREESVILDGEIVSLDQDDKPSFQRMQIRERVADPQKVLHYAKLYPARYIVFDILSLKGKSLTDLPFHERMAYLEKTLIKSENITTTDSFPDGESLLNLMRERN